MSTVVALPVRVDALWTEQGSPSTGPLADASRLPWVDGRTGVDRNPDTPSLADVLELDPFEVAGHLEPGVHLHWALPDCMRRAVHPLDPSTGAERGDRVEFPRVPDRWLVSRSGGGLPDRRWLVQSDHLWGPYDRTPPGTIQVLLPSWRWQRGLPRHRALGRTVDLTASGPWVEPPSLGWEAATGLPLTAVGPFESLSFAAHYPSCRSVFGLHDPDPVPLTTGVAALRYEVVGWYRDASADLIASTVAARGRVGQGPQGALKDHLHLELPPDLHPERAAVIGVASLASPTPTRAAEETIQVAVGRSPAEALVAHLADEVDDLLPLRQADAEACLQALRVGRMLEGFRLDLGPRLAQALHEEGFTAVDGGTRWRLVRRGELDAAERAATPDQITLPLGVAHALEVLNAAQARLDRAGRLLDRAAENLHADWARTQRSLYRASDGSQDLPAMDAALAFLRRRLEAEREDAADPTSPPVVPGTRDLAQASAAAKAARLALDLLVEQHNLASPDEEDWSLLEVPATRYWQPADPAVLLAAPPGTDLVQASARYHAVLPDPQTVELPAWSPEGVLDALAAQPTSRPLSEPHDGADHHPILLEWRAEVTPVQASRHLDPEHRRFDPDWVGDAFRLRQTDQDLVPGDPAALLYSGGLVYSGRSILTPSASTAMRAQLEGWLGRWVRRRLTDWREAEAARRGAAASEPASDPSVSGASEPAVSASSEPAVPPAASDPASPEPAAEAQPRGRSAAAAWTAPWAAEGGAPKAVEEVLAAPGLGRAAFVSWLADHVEDAGAEHPALVVLAGLQVLDHRGETLLGQQLSGLNRTLLGLRDGLPLEVDDPLAFSSEASLAADLRRALGAALGRQGGGTRPRSLPRPSDEFLPVLSGELRLLDLRLVDSFGRPTDLRWTEVDRPAALASQREDRLALPPRLLQPARLSFRWLSASPLDALGTVDAEVNDHPATSPVCGWLVANHVDRSVQVFDADGSALGSVAPPGRWRMPPGAESGVMHPGEIANPFLRRMAQWVVDGAAVPGFLERFLDAQEAALEAIDPEGFHLHEARALLTSRPLAVVRAQVSLELQGEAAVDQGWHAWRGVIDGGPPDTRGVEALRFPVRIGEHAMLDDGVVGFLVEGERGFVDERLHCPQGVAMRGSSDRVEVWEPGHPALNPSLSVADPALRVTMLVDPRCRVHASTGILPARSLSLPPDQFRESLRRIAVSFGVAPLLCGPEELELDLPDEPGWTWSWLERSPEGWHSRLPGGEGPDRIVPAPLGPATSPTVAREGWLLLQPAPPPEEP